MREKHHWDVGIDLTDRSHGAIRFAHWLSSRSAAPEALRGVYVGSTATIRREHPGAGSPIERARSMARATTEALDAAASYVTFDALLSDKPAEELSTLASEADVEGLVIGRSAPVEGWSLISLGRVARRLLRALPRPVVVVPPDLDPASLGHGPILVGIQQHEHVLPAIRFARALAERLDLSLVLLHMIPEPRSAPIFAGPEAPLAALPIDRDKLRENGVKAVTEWLRARRLDDLPRRVELGYPGPGLVEHAKELNASMIVCGSRQLSLRERIFHSSTSSEVAAIATRPVIVVPSDNTRARSKHDPEEEASRADSRDWVRS